MSKEKLFSITKEDFDFQFFRGSGAGGQKKNKTSSACRCIHRASRAVGVAQDERSQSKNKTLAWQRCINTPEFKNWHRLETSARLQGFASLERKVEEQMKEENIQIEYYDPSEV